MKALPCPTCGTAKLIENGQKKDYTIGKAPSTFARGQDLLYRCACMPKLAKSLRLTRAQFLALPEVQG